MKTFIEISKMIRSRYKKELSFIAAMCKRPQREDVQLYLEKYFIFKQTKS
ncbi:hypothetical protein LCGC14_2123140 [marine sediment metagenome]|uniref:Uncharacterized protein n=1 Tax=marine sediment metagenome TaxID=412755 RepID=A0A0F9E3L6_9ZZZZ